MKESDKTMPAANLKRNIAQDRSSLYTKAVRSGAFTVSSDGSKNLNIGKLLEIEEAVSRLKQISEEIQSTK